MIDKLLEMQLKSYMNHQKPKKNQLLSGKFALYILAGVFLLFAFNFGRAYYQNFQVRQEIKELEAQVKGLETKKLESLEILKFVSSDDYVEEKARTELHMKKPGEKVLILNTKQYESDMNNKKKELNILTNPKKWFYYFITHQLPNNL